MTAKLGVEEAGVWRGWFDGAAHPNPGRMGLGAVLHGPDGEQFEISRIAAGQGCNNEAEARALCALLELALQHSAKRLDIRGDSDIVIRLVPDPRATEALRLAPLFAEARRLMAAIGESSLLWVPRHRNADADRLSRAALGLPAKPAKSFKTHCRKKRGTAVCDSVSKSIVWRRRGADRAVARQAEVDKGTIDLGKE